MEKLASNITWGVDELYQTFWFEQFFNGKLCRKIYDLLSVPIMFLDWFARSYLSMNVCLKLTMGDFVCVFDAWRKWSESFVFDQGGIHIPSLACLFDFVIWDEWLQR